MEKKEVIRAIVYREGSEWVAQCLEVDIAAQAPDLKQLQERLEATLVLEAQQSKGPDGRPFKGIDPAPEHFQKMWETRAGALKPVNPALAVIDGTATVDLALCA